jgi:hypothetical protein
MGTSANIWEVVSGISNAIMALGTFVAVWIGWRGLHTWKEQKRAERDLDLARRVIAEVGVYAQMMLGFKNDIDGEYSLIDDIMKDNNRYSMMKNPNIVRMLNDGRELMTGKRTKAWEDTVRISSLIAEVDLSWNAEFSAELEKVQVLVVESYEFSYNVEAYLKHFPFGDVAVAEELERFKNLKPTERMAIAIQSVAGDITAMARTHLNSIFKTKSR